MRIAVVEDDSRACVRLANLIDEYFDARGYIGSVQVFSTAEMFLGVYEPSLFDLLVLDIFLSEDPDGKTGMDIARAVRAANDRMPIVFITSSRDFAVEGYTVQAAGYLIKPVDGDQLARTFDAMRLPEPLVRVGGNRLPVRVSDVMWVESDGHYTELHAAREMYRVRENFSTAQAALEVFGGFFLSARGYLVNLAYVKDIQGADFVLRNGQYVPISRKNVKAARAAWSDYVFNKVRGL